MREKRCFVGCVLLVCQVACFGGTDFGIDDCAASDPPAVADYWRSDGRADVTFLAFGDTQYYREDEDKNDKQVAALNAVSGKLRWNAFGVDEAVTRIRGVVIAGDLTQNGRDGRMNTADEYGRFTHDYGLCGNGSLHHRVYEGYGNHDFFEWAHVAYRALNAHPVVDSVSVRNPYRVGLLEIAPGTDGHYSWEWDDVHFVQLNLAPSDDDPELDIDGLRNPRLALSFLKRDLRLHVQGTRKRVVIISHYGPWSTFEWDDAQAERLYEAIADYDVIGWIHGHDHGTSAYTWHDIPIWNVGSPYYYSSSEGGEGGDGGDFAVFRIMHDTMYVGNARWDPNDPTEIAFPTSWSRTIVLP